MNLVTIVVATYNSEKYILESLESTACQGYANLELIITDDCSSDNTLLKCNEWLLSNNSKFVRIELLTSSTNTGVSANLNRALTISKGEWIIFLAGDDSLKKDCIINNILYLRNNPEIKVLFSKIDVFNNIFDSEHYIKTVPNNPYHVNGLMHKSRTAESQYKMLLVCDRIHYSPSAWLHRETLVELGGFDEYQKRLEDYPLWLKLTKNGVRLYFMDIVTVNYRQHIDALNNTGFSYFINPNYFKQEHFRRSYTYPYLPWDIKLNQKYIWVVSQPFRYAFFNKKTIVIEIIYNILSIYLNPFRYIIYIRKKTIQNKINNEFYQ